jgi:hypothetical protein
LTASAIGAQFDDEYEKLPFLRFNEAAQEIFSEWRCGLELRLRSGELMTALESPLAKYRKLIPTLALINHLADNGTGAFGDMALLRALAFAKYLETHATRAYGAGADPDTAAAQAILKHIRRGDLKDGFTARDVHQSHWANLSDIRQVQSAGSICLRNSTGCAAIAKKPAAAPPWHIRSTRKESHHHERFRAAGQSICCSKSFLGA